MTAEYNRIIKSGYIEGVGIRIVENNNTYTTNYSITFNDVDVEQGYACIDAESVSQPIIYYNTTSIHGDADINQACISVNACDGALVTCNTMKGNDASPNSMKGFECNVSDNSYIGCNGSDSTGIGFFFGGICLYTQMLGDSMNNHDVGLYLNNVAVIDTQTHAGNKWIGTYGSGYGAVNMNDSTFQNLRKSLFVVDLSLGSTYFPSTPTSSPNNVGWFEDTVGTPFSCYSGTCIVARDEDGGGGSDELRMSIVQDNTITSDFIPESKAMAKQALYPVLKSNSALTATNIIYQDFVLNNDSGAIGYLYETQKLIKESSKADSTYILSLHETDSLIKTYKDSIHQVDSLLRNEFTSNNFSLRNSYINQLSILNQNYNGITLQQKSSAIVKLDNAIAKNDSVSANDLPLTNEKFINQIELVYKTNNNSLGSIASYYPDIFDVATQCPYLGGKSVYRARAFVRLFNDTVKYSDALTCSQAGIQKNSHFNPISKLGTSIKIIPNPAKDNTDIILNGFNEGICSIKIKNSLGAVVFSSKFNCSSKKYSLSTNHFVAGIYVVEIIIKTDISYCEKLVILK